jgi:hypothetical protein
MKGQTFIINQPVAVEETRHHEFKEIKGGRPLDTIKNTCDEYVVAFLNSAGGRIFWGIRDADRHAVGVLLSIKERDELRKVVTNKLNQIQPPISPTAYQINLHPVYEDETCEKVVEDRYIVEIVAPDVLAHDLYSTGSGEVFVRTDSGKRKLNFQEIQDEIRRRHMQEGRPEPLAVDEAKLSNAALRILYLHGYNRSTGFDYLSSPRLVEELRRRGHEVRLCWAVHELLAHDDLNTNRDLVPPESVREWQPHVLIFERSLFVGDPKIPLPLLQELEMQGTVVILEVEDYHERKEKYREFLEARGITVEEATDPRKEQPTCRAFFDRYLRTSVEDLRGHTHFKDEQIYSGVESVAASHAYPVRAGFDAHTLVVGGQNVHVKAYGDERLHEQPFPVYGVLVEHDFRTEAIFFGGVIWDPPDQAEEFDNHIYLANLAEWLYLKRKALLHTGW